MNYFQRITLELAESYGSVERLARLAMTTPATIKRICAGKSEPTYSLGDRLMRMHASLMDAEERKK